jgi:4-carboxymuconolactone decarboxylase
VNHKGAELLNFVRISCAVCVRSEFILERELISALNNKIDPAIIREVILQTYLFAGFASTINAMIVFNRLVPGNKDYLREIGESLELWRERGIELCKQVYGNQFEKMVENMNQLHPDLADWMIIEGYGKVLSRPFLNPMIRELLIVAMTAVLNVERQFHSHVRGALNVGAKPDEISRVFAETKSFMDPATIPTLEKLLQQILSRK